MLLVHHIAADHTPVVIDDDGAVATLADRAYHALRHTARIVGIAELIKQLLLLVVADYALVGNSSPEILMLVDVDDSWDCLNTHTRKGLLHVALKRLCLRVIDAIARRGLYQQVSVEHFLNRVDIAVVKR